MSRRHHRRPLVAAGLAAASVGVVACSNDATSDGSTRDESGEVVEGGEVGAFALRLGDCIAEASTQDEFDSLPVVPCDEPHQLEIYHVFDLADGDWPGDAEIQDRAARGCLDAFAGFVGLEFSASVYDVTPLRPTEASWNEIDDREVLCALFELDGALRTGTARGSTR